MNRDDAKQFMVKHATQYLKPDRAKQGFICPVCGSGSGDKGTGITSKDGNEHFTCWAHDCFRHADIIDIIGVEYNLTKYNDKLMKAAECFGIEIEGGYVNIEKPKPRKQEEAGGNNLSHKQDENYTQYFRECAKNISLTDYPEKRGLSRSTTDRFMIGYDANYKRGTGGAVWGALIIPTGKGSFSARNTDPNADSGNRYRKTGSVSIFNLKALERAKGPIFIVEGEIDALSILEAGFEAVGLGSTSNVGMFVEAVKSAKSLGKEFEYPFIISMDNDESGQPANAKLAEGLKGLEVDFYVADIASPYKDPNEALTSDRKAFEKALKRAVNVRKAEHEKESAAYSLASFMENIEKSKTASFYSTGFFGLDCALDGGLYSGLYIVGAISSLGKTTFCLQMADNIAANGNDVLIFSLEMARDELIAKSVSRETFKIANEKYGDAKHAKTTRGILTGSRYEGYSKTERSIIQEAILKYGEYAKNIYITQGVGDVDINVIREKIKSHIQITGKRPVVLIDYLQIIAPAEPRATDKQNTDKAVLELKRMSRDFNIPIVGISSFNRDNYFSPVNLASFKESGAIEYSSDVLIGMQYDGMDWVPKENDKKRSERIRGIMDDMIQKAKAGEPQSVQIKVLKNRNGSKGDVYVEFIPMFNYFRDNVGEEEPPEEWTQLSTTDGDLVK